MIYPKFPQRYLAAIVFCLILTLAALGGMFLIYLFNGNSTPLLFTADTNAAVAKPPNYFYGNDDKLSSYKQNFLHKESQLQRDSAELHSIKDELVTLDELAVATTGSISSEQQVPKSLKQQKQRVTIRRENYHRMISAASEPVLATSDELSLEHQQAMFSQQQKLQHQPQLLQPNSDTEESIEKTAKEVSAENDDDGKLVSALTSIESFQYQIPSSSSENSDTIYIDDFERQSSSGDIHVDDTNDSDDVVSDINMGFNNFTDAVVDEIETNSVITTTSSSATAVAQNSSSIMRFNYKPHSKQRNNKRRLAALVKKKRKQQRLLSKLQHKNSNSNNIVKFNSDKQLKHLQYSTQKVKKHLNLQHREHRFSAYDSNSSSGGINDVDDIIVNSGSGDFNSDDNNDNDDSDDDYDIDADTANYIKRINMKMWRTMSNVAGNSNAQRKGKLQYKQHQQQLRQLHAFNNKQKKHRRFQHKQEINADSKNQNSRDLPNDVDNFYSISSEIVSNLSAPQLNHEKNTLAPTVTMSQQDKDSSMRKSNNSNSSSSNNNRINQISTATTRNVVGITNNSQWLFSPTYSVNNVTSSTSIHINNTSTSQQQQQQLSSRVTDLAAPADPVVKSATSGGSAAWLETRTRRIMGNVKKSEERSRQLLLCEEAGGGELCRMLFKGHLNE